MSSLQRRLTITLAALCCILWLGGSVAAYLMMRAGLIHEFDFGRKADVDSLVNMTEQSEKGLKFDSTGELMPAFQRADRPDYFQLWASDGSSLYRSPSLENANLARRQGTLAAPAFWNVTLADGRAGRAVGVRFTPKEDEDEARTPGGPRLDKQVTLVAAFHRSELDRRLHLMGMVLLLVGVAMAGTIALILGPTIRRVIRPLALLGERAAAINAESLQLRFPIGGLPRELQPIGQRLNDLLERLEASFNRERRFSADVAHELRTPVAELRALAEVALKWPDDHVANQSAFADALGIALRMQSTTNSLLELARCESNRFSAQPENIDIPALLREILSPLEPEAQQKGLAFCVNVPAEASWITDRSAFRGILSNLLSNAVHYSPPSSTIRVRTSATGVGEQLSVSNNSTDLSARDVDHVFERLWRKEKARSSPLHSGLGLSLARAYAHALGMNLTAELIHREITFTISNLRSSVTRSGNAFNQPLRTGPSSLLKPGLKGAASAATASPQSSA